MSKDVQVRPLFPAPNLEALRGEQVTEGPRHRPPPARSPRWRRLSPTLSPKWAVLYFQMQNGPPFRAARGNYHLLVISDRPSDRLRLLLLCLLCPQRSLGFPLPFELRQGVGHVVRVDDRIPLTELVCQPPIFMMTVSGIPARRRLRAAVLRRSWKISPE